MPSSTACSQRPGAFAPASIVGLPIAVVVMLVLVASVLGQKAVSKPAVRLSCGDGGASCRVEFDLDNGQQHAVDLVKEEHSVFASDAILHDSASTYRIAERRLEGVRYHSKGTGAWATALISHDGTELLDGIFSTDSQGVIEWTKSGESHRRRLSEVLEEDLVLELPEGKPWLKRNTNDRLGDVGLSEDNTTFDAASEFGVVRPFFPSCFTGDSVTHVFKVNMVYDHGLYLHLTANVPGDETAKRNKILSDLETLFSFGKLLYLSQLNVRLEIQRVIFGTATDPVPLSRGGGSNSCLGATTMMSEWMAYLSRMNPQDPTGYWLLMSNCFSTGVNGVSYIGNACGRGNNGGVAAYSWNVAFHELGHAFGMSHSFENGVGRTGGLMDYGNIKFDGVVQFHPLKRPEVCAFLDYLKTTHKCEFLKPAVSSVVCGDGVLDKAEQCECLQRGSTACGKCQSCKLTDKTIECSTADFIVRQPTTPAIFIVDSSKLPSPQCCIRNKLAAPKTLCGATNTDVCGVGGKCVKTCSLYLLSNNPVCNFDDSGCMIGCIWKNRCRFDMTFTKEDGTDGFVSALPDGSACSLPGGSEGQCSNAKCVTIPSDGSDRDPDPPASLTPRPTSTPTRPVVTSSPTAPPTLEATQTPTLHPVAKEATRCSAFKNKRRCQTMRCRWCTRSCKPISTGCRLPATRARAGQSG